MNSTKLFLAGALAISLCARAQDVQHLSITQPGGMPGWPVITGISRGTNGVNVTWDGPAGYYELFEARSLHNPAWVAVGKDTNLNRIATVPGGTSNAFFKISGPAPIYAGSEACAQCHSPILNTEVNTRHAAAFTNALFVTDGGQTNTACLACHTLGFDLPTGFVNQTKTPHLTSVQCENCHGPAASHAANPDDPAVRPRAEIAATLCGGCHTDPRHPIFEEWTASSHAQVIGGLNATNQIDSCGRCHSGSVRLSLLETNALPMGDAQIGIVCATCHDPHQTNANPAQLRNPIASTNDYFMPPNGSFLSQYNPKINVCGQCHNHAGASWTNNACAPHHSPQYNMLLGTIGELASGAAPYQPGSHALLITNQCVDCHMQTTPFVSSTQPANKGHNFEVYQYGLCVNCHDTPGPLVTFVTGDVSNQIQQVKSDLDYWAAHSTNTAVQILFAKYGNLAWEYTTPGELSSGGKGPNATEQTEIPENIQKARFNLYVVLQDGSFGVHNPLYTITLLQTAEDWIEEELEP